MATVHFGSGIFHSKTIAAMSSSVGQGYRISPGGTLTYSAVGSISGLVSGRTGATETYRYGLEVEPEPVGRTQVTYNANGVQLHPIICLATDKPGAVWERYLAGGPAGSTILNVYSGVMPTSTNLVTNLNNYSSNLLISFSMGAGSAGVRFTTHDLVRAQNIIISNTYKNPGVVQAILGICPTQTAAVNSGQATWFWFGNSSNQTDLSDIAFVIGSIGQVDDGSCEMVMPNNNIEIGQMYLSSGFKFTFPSIISV